MKYHHIPPLSALRAFEATVRHCSVSKAASELHLTDGAISRAVREVEVVFGMPLFERRHRAIVPYPAALFLADAISNILQQLSEAFDRTHFEMGSSRPIVISCEPTFLMRWLIPRLPQLQDLIGIDREIRLTAGGGKVEFSRDGIDLAIRRSDFPIDEDIHTAPFMEEWIGPVHRPQTPCNIKTLSAVEGILLHTATRRDAWNTWANLSNFTLRPERNLNFEHFYLSLQAAVAGVGLAIGPIALVADDLKSGILTAPYGFVKDGTEYMLLAKKTYQEKSVFNDVFDWLRSNTVELKF